MFLKNGGFLKELVLWQINVNKKRLLVFIHQLQYYTLCCPPPQRVNIIKMTSKYILTVVDRVIIFLIIILTRLAMRYEKKIHMSSTDIVKQTQLWIGDSNNACTHFCQSKASIDNIKKKLPVGLVRWNFCWS